MKIKSKPIEKRKLPTPASKRGRGRPTEKTIEQHVKDGTYIKYHHGAIPEAKLIKKPSFRIPVKRIDWITKKWIKSEADELAVAQGCRFDERLPDYFARCFHKYLRHSKGRWADKPFDLLDWQANDVIYPLFGWLNPDGYRRYRTVYIEIPKKNGKSTLASAIGIAYLIFDDEPGAEVYSCAADREQSGIVHGEAINMLEASYDLSTLVKVNRTNKMVTYKRKKSYYKALSKSIEGKEGYNIHCAICDELHIWKGRQVWDALRYGFAARDQPCCFSITTAGEDMQSVCREQHDYADSVIKGSIIDPSFLGIIYRADNDKWQDESEWHKSNPSLGHTLKIEEFRSAYSQLKVRPSEEPNFKRRRLNIWCTSTKVWIDSHDWVRNKRDVDDDVLRGKMCSMGIDLAKTKDATAIVLAFPDYDGERNWYLKPFIFLPEDRVDEIKHLVQQLPIWIRDGDLITTDGNVADYDYISHHILDWIDRHNVNVQSVVFDPYNAEQFTRELAEKLVCDRFAFGQTINNYAEPTEEFERCVIKGMMHHSGNQMMAWQFGHCLIATDKGGRIKPVRFERKDIRTIDCCVSAIMGFAKASDVNNNYYDGGGVWT